MLSSELLDQLKKKVVTLKESGRMSAGGGPGAKAGGGPGGMASPPPTGSDSEPAFEVIDGKCFPATSQPPNGRPGRATNQVSRKYSIVRNIEKSI